jgi:hypothetical protein
VGLGHVCEFMIVRLLAPIFPPESQTLLVCSQGQEAKAAQGWRDGYLLQAVLVPHAVVSRRREAGRATRRLR